MIRVLVTGADGQLGRCVQKISNDFPELEFEFHTSRTMDITDAQKVSSVFSKGNYNYCINCAAYTDVEQAERTPEPAFTVNGEAVKNLAIASYANEVTLIHISTDYVFDGKKETPYLPGDRTNPINEYGKSKLLGEAYVQEFLVSFFIVRTSWLYSEFGKNFYKTVLKKARAGEDLQITDAQTGCPTNANNLANYILNLIATESVAYGIHHFTDGEAMTWHGFAHSILKKHNLEGRVKLDKAKNYRTFAKRPKYSILAK